MSSSIHAFLNANTAYCAGIPAGPVSEGEILVDCLVGHPGYLLGNLYIARYLQSLRGGRLRALVAQTQPTMNAILKSFGVVSAFPEDKFLQQANPRSDQLARAVIGELGAPELSPAERRKRLLALRLDGIEIGDLIYDSYLRDTGNVTVTDLTAELRERIVIAFRYFFAYAEIVQRNPINYVVVGHTVYSRFGMLVRIAIKHGAMVVARKPASNRVVIRLYDAAHPQDNHEKHVPHADLGRLLKDRQGTLSAEGRRLAETTFADPEPESRGSGQASLPDGVLDEVLAETGADRPVVAVFSHCFTDANHYSASMLHDDYYHWLRDTIAYALNDPSKTWLIKGHPHAVHYKEKMTVSELVAEMAQGASHVRLVPEQVTVAQLAPRLSAIVANAGSVCVEGPMFGVPTISAGLGIWSGYGFDHVAHTLEQYYDLLECAGALPAVTEDQRELAFALYALVRNEISVTSAILPEITDVWWKSIDVDAVFAHAGRRLAELDYPSDPFYRALANGLEEGGSILLPAESAPMAAPAELTSTVA